MTHQQLLTATQHRFLSVAFDETIPELIKDPAFRAKIKSICLSCLQLSTKKSPINLLTITIATNNRPLLLGAFVYFPLEPMRGFHNEYIAQRMEKELRVSGAIDNDSPLIVVLDVVPEANKFGYLYRTLPLEEAIGLGILFVDSPLVHTMRKYSLRTILLAGDEISAPNATMISAIEKTCREFRPKTCLDVFSGTGSLAKVAIANGVHKVVCIENNSLLREYFDSKITLIDGVDAWTFRPQRNFDLVILDPFYDWGLRVAREILPRLIHRTKHFIFNIGYSYNQYWSSLVRKEIEKVSGSVQLLSEYENLVVVGSRPK